MSTIDILIIMVACVLIVNIHAYASDRIIVTDDDIIVCTTDENGVTVCL